MSFERFHFNCRMIKKNLDSGDSVRDSCRMISSSVSDEFGKLCKGPILAKSILKELKLYGSSERNKLEKALEIYSELNFSILLNKPTKIRRVSAYLCWLTVVFIYMCVIFNLFVAPQFMDFFESMEIQPPSDFIWFSNNWNVIVSTIVASLVISFLISIEINKLFKFDRSKNDTFIYKYLLSSKLKEKHQKIIWLAKLPMNISGYKDNVLVNHFGSNEYSNVEIAKEISALLSFNMRELIEHSESFIQKIMVAIGILIISSIFMFLSSSYAPIFVIGDAI